MRTLVLAVRGDEAAAPPGWPSLAEVVGGKREGTHELLEGNEVHVWAVDPFLDHLPPRWDLERRLEAGAAAIVRQIDACERFEVLIAGQTRLMSGVVRGLADLQQSKRPRLIVRFSVFYGGKTYGAYSPDAPPGLAGYHLDCPRDYACLLELLKQTELLAAAAAADVTATAEAVAAFNEAHPQYPPLLVL